MKITLTKAEVEWYAECYKGLPPTEHQRFVSALEADEFLGRRLRVAAQRGYLTVCDLEEVARWKFPGPKLRALVAENPTDKVRKISEASFSASAEEQERIDGLRELRGVGWPMASTILHFVFPCCYPILDVRAIRAVGCKPNYGFGMWKKFTELCRETADEYAVTLRDLDRALWTSDYMRTPLGSGPLPHRQLLVGAKLISKAAEGGQARELLHRIVSESEHEFKLFDGWNLEPEDRVLERAQGCLLGQIAGDSLGSLVEFRTPEDIRSEYPDGVRDLADGGPFNLLAGQPTDDSEMALVLARLLAEQGAYSAKEARRCYELWVESYPFDIGHAVLSGLTGRKVHGSQANGALMRISPLGIFGAKYERKQVAQWAEQDAAITHPNPVCRQANALFASGIALAVRTGCAPSDLYREIVTWAEELNADDDLFMAIRSATESPPPDFFRHQGWVLIALRNALWQLLHAPNLEDGLIDTVRRGGDTDTNAAICGALLGAVYGRDSVPERWIDRLLACRPEEGRPNVHQPRPACYWPVDALKLAERLIRPRH